MSVNIKTENGLVQIAGKVNSFPVNKISSSDYLEDSPIGTVISFMGTTAPSHYLVCDGTVYNIADYSDLADFFQSQFGSKNYFGGNGTTTFAVPDLDNEFEDSISCIKYESTYFMQITDVGYSTSETLTGKTWIDGKPIYRKVINNLILINGRLNIPNSHFYEHIININGYFIPTDDPDNINFIPYSNNNMEVMPATTSSGLVIDNNYSGFVGRIATLIIEYTKTTD